MSHESVKYFDSINIENKDDFDIPDIYYGLYQNIIAISQYNHEAHIFCNTIDNSSNLESIEAILNNKSYSVFSFKKDGQPESTITDNEYLDYVKKAKDHCKRGDVFQLVLSRRFMQKFSGDEFNVYRALRSINPSPYLFFFDYGDYKIFGSSPEAQIIIKDGKSEIHPIAGTFKRTGNDEEDHITATELAKDPKENSEHIMLVDLARNDLSRSGNNVKVEKNREIQFYSHVIHLVSKVTAILKKNIKPFKVVEDTFPAGTLTGAPKHKALELIEKYEKVNRNFYGGAIGYIDFNGNFNHAIVILIDSVPEKELEEVKNKLGALDKALNDAELIK
jgi:anthranilate synthase component 1